MSVAQSRPSSNSHAHELRLREQQTDEPRAITRDDDMAWACGGREAPPLGIEHTETDQRHMSAVSAGTNGTQRMSCCSTDSLHRDPRTSTPYQQHELCKRP